MGTSIAVVNRIAEAKHAREQVFLKRSLDHRKRARQESRWETGTWVMLSGYSTQMPLPPTASNSENKCGYVPIRNLCYLEVILTSTIVGVAAYKYSLGETTLISGTITVWEKQLLHLEQTPLCFYLITHLTYFLLKSNSFLQSQTVCF